MHDAGHAQPALWLALLQAAVAAAYRDREVAGLGVRDHVRRSARADLVRVGGESAPGPRVPSPVPFRPVPPAPSRRTRDPYGRGECLDVTA